MLLTLSLARWMLGLAMLRAGGKLRDWSWVADRAAYKDQVLGTSVYIFAATVGLPMGSSLQQRYAQMPR